MSYSPTSLPRNPDWRDDAECRRADCNIDPELFHPAGTTGPWIAQIEEAQAVCRTCPVMQQCAQWALDNRESGIWGGMTDQDRVNWRRRMARERAAAEKPLPVLRPNLTLAEVYAELTGPADEDGHVDWLGGGATTVGGSCYSPNRLTWAATRGTSPVGSVVRYCDRANCVAHIEDRAEREARKATESASPRHGQCGTNSGYQTHRNRHEPVCDPCREAHAESSRQYRATAQAKRPTASPDCGTTSGHRGHLDRGEAPCAPCMDAHARTAWLLKTA